MRNHWLVPFSATCIGENSPAPIGIKNYVCLRLPESFSLTFLVFFSREIIDIMKPVKYFSKISTGRHSV